MNNRDFIRDGLSRPLPADLPEGVWPKAHMLRTEPELPLAERIARYQWNIRLIRASGCLVPSALEDSLDAEGIQAWFEEKDRVIASLKRAIRAVGQAYAAETAR